MTRIEICEQLKALRKEQHLTQQQLAEKIGTFKSVICRLEKGKVSPSFDMVIRYLKPLGYTLTPFPDYEAPDPIDQPPRKKDWDQLRQPKWYRGGENDNPRIYFCHRLGEIRMEQGISQQDLEIRAGVVRGYLSEIEAGRYSPTLDTILSILQSLGYTIEFVPYVSLTPNFQLS